MNFRKYPSIENSYRQKEIEMWLKHYPELANEQFVAPIKLDGCNLNIWFTPDGMVRLGKKSTFIGTIDQDVYFQGVNLKELFNSNDLYKMLIIAFQQMSIDTNDEITIYGELFGKGIQNRVNYGEGKYFRAFDIAVNGVFLPQSKFIVCMFKIFGVKYNNIICSFPHEELFESLEEALNFNIVFKSLLTPDGYEKDNFEEGVVIKPWNRIYTSPQGSVFYLKKKNPKFADKEGTTQKEKRPVNESLSALNKEFKSYINENRVLDVFSKYGTISQMSQIGEYIRYVIEDAKEDFLKDNDFTGDKSAEKIVYNCGSLILDILKKYL